MVWKQDSSRPTPPTLLQPYPTWNTRIYLHRGTCFVPSSCFEFNWQCTLDRFLFTWVVYGDVYPIKILRKGHSRYPQSLSPRAWGVERYQSLRYWKYLQEAIQSRTVSLFIPLTNISSDELASVAVQAWLTPPRKYPLAFRMQSRAVYKQSSTVERVRQIAKRRMFR